jgi:hypothetical protein
MKTEYILIDYENVQPRDLELVKTGAFNVKIFVGPHQSKILTSVATVLHALGANGEYIMTEGSGRNAADFHIAYYLGELSCKKPDT